MSNALMRLPSDFRAASVENLCRADPTKVSLAVVLYLAAVSRSLGRRRYASRKVEMTFVVSASLAQSVHVDASQ